MACVICACHCLELSGGFFNFFSWIIYSPCDIAGTVVPPLSGWVQDYIASALTLYNNQLLRITTVGQRDGSIDWSHKIFCFNCLRWRCVNPIYPLSLFCFSWTDSPKPKPPPPPGELLISRRTTSKPHVMYTLAGVCVYSTSKFSGGCGGAIFSDDTFFGFYFYQSSLHIFSTLDCRGPPIDIFFFESYFHFSTPPKIRIRIWFLHVTPHPSRTVSQTYSKLYVIYLYIGWYLCV